MNSLHVLQVTPRYPPQSGGVETHVQKISERLVHRGHEVTVVTADAGNDGRHREFRNGVRILRYRSMAPGGAIHLCPQISVVVRRSDADIVHAHNYHSFPLFFATVGASARPVVATTHYHGASASSLRDRLLSLYQPVGRWAVRRADRVIAVSDWEREQLLADFGVDATVIPNGVDVERFEEAEPYQRERPYLLTVGRLEEYKGVQYVIRTMTELPDYDLLVAGSGPYREELERVAHRCGVADRVVFLGYVEEERLQSLYAGSVAYITMSALEAYGRTVGEALAAGTECVVRNTGALRDWTHYSSVTAVADPRKECIAAAVRECEQRETSTALPTWTRVTDDVVEIYTQLVPAQ